MSDPDAERKALNALVAAENARNSNGFWLAVSLSSFAKAHPDVLPDYLARELAAFDEATVRYDAAMAAFRAARDAAKADMAVSS